MDIERRLESMRKSMLYFALKLTDNVDDAEDAVQDACLGVINRPPEEWGLNFLTLIVQRRIIDKLRKKKPSVSLSAIPEESHVFAVVQELRWPDTETSDLLASLPLHERVLIEAVADSEDGLTGAAASLGVSEQALKAELHRVRGKLKTPCEAKETLLF